MEDFVGSFGVEGIILYKKVVFFRSFHCIPVGDYFYVELSESITISR